MNFVMFQFPSLVQAQLLNPAGPEKGHAQIQPHLQAGQQKRLAEIRHPPQGQKAQADHQLLADLEKQLKEADLQLQADVQRELQADLERNPTQANLNSSFRRFRLVKDSQIAQKPISYKHKIHYITILMVTFQITLWIFLCSLCKYILY